MKKLNIDEQRELLMRRKEEAQAEVSNTLQTAAFAAGAILLGFLVVKVIDELTDKKTAPVAPPSADYQPPVYQPQPPAQESGFSVINFLKEQLAFFLVSLAKDKMHELIDFALDALRSQKAGQPPQQHEEST
ncbi:hypothetical protein [Rhodoflexus sp.]